MDTKTALLDLAEDLARTRGFDAFSYADLAAALDIRKASIHYHFATKGTLALDMVTRYRTAFMAQLDALTDQHPLAIERLHAYVALYRRALGKGDRLCLCVAFSASRDSFAPDVLAQINGFHRDCLNWLADVYALGEIDGTLTNDDPALAAHACLALVEGAQIMARAAQDPALFDRATTLLLKG